MIHMNVGTFFFLIILIYLILMFFVYLTRDHVTGYEVVEGTLAGNYRYRALALKTEEIEKAQESGAITYYAREGSKAFAGVAICAIGGVSQAGQNLTTDLQDTDLEDAKNQMSTFVINYRRESFSSVYDFKSNLEAVILQSSVDENAGSYVGGTYSAPSSGFVLYSTDGFELYSQDNLTRDLFNESSYKKTNLRLNSEVSAGDPIYKLVTSNSWKLYFPIDDNLRTQLDGMSKITLRFLKDNNTFTAPFHIVTGYDGWYGEISLNSCLVRYVTDRFLEIELMINRTEGLKIPTSAISTRLFYQIPADYVTVNDDSKDEIFLIREKFKSDGSSSRSTIRATVYAHDEELDTYLVDRSLFSNGDYVVMPGTTKRFEISENAIRMIQGVFNINKGYAVFREVKVNDENEEFCIIEPNNIYGLRAHDRIALNAASVREDQITA